MPLFNVGNTIKKGALEVCTVYVICSQLFFSKLRLEVLMESCRNSQSPCDFITSCENCVAREEFEKGTRRISFTAEREKRELRVQSGTETR